MASNLTSILHRGLSRRQQTVSIEEPFCGYTFFIISKKQPAEFISTNPHLIILALQQYKKSPSGGDPKGL
jgi:hypothetical protein